MSILKVIEDIEKFDPEVYERIGSRRATIHNVGKVGMKVALAAVPLALGSIFNKAYGKGQAHEKIVGVLNFALTLEYLEAEFYNMGLAASGLLDGRERKVIGIIAMHENQHVEFLKKTITALGSMPVDKPMFDFTAGGAFPDVFSNLETYLVLSQAFEDTGVRAYKGQAANLMENDAVLTAALQIHSVEARHAAKIRTMRGQKGWVRFDLGGNMPPAADPVYAGEANTTHAGVNLLEALPMYSREAITEAFDEPLDKAQVLAIASMFIKQ